METLLSDLIAVSRVQLIATFLLCGLLTFLLFVKGFEKR